MATQSDRPRKKRTLTDFSDDLPTPEKVEREQKMLKSFTEREDALRALVTCKICFRLLYEPFTNECGHSYCYTCLCQWFKSAPHGRKTCPDCRKKLTHAPSPAFALRELTRELTSRPELLPPDETVEGHSQLRKEETKAVETDKANSQKSEGGLFSGCFKGSATRTGILDAEDHVYRCPECAWELDESLDECERCGAVLHVPDDGSDVDFDDDLVDYDQEFHRSMSAWAEGEDGYNDSDSDSSHSPGLELVHGDRSETASSRRTNQHASYPSGRVISRRYHYDPADDDEEAEENSDYDSSLNGFIDDEDVNEDDEDSNDENMDDEGNDDGSDDNESDRSSGTSNSTTGQEQARLPRRTRYVVIESDEESDEATPAATTDAGSRGNLGSCKNRLDPETAHLFEDSSDSGPRRRYVRSRHRRVVDDEDDDSEQESGQSIS